MSPAVAPTPASPTPTPTTAPSVDTWKDIPSPHTPSLAARVLCEVIPGVASIGRAVYGKIFGTPYATAADRLDTEASAVVQMEKQGKALAEKILGITESGANMRKDAILSSNTASKTLTEKFHDAAKTVSDKLMARYGGVIAAKNGTSSSLDAFDTSLQTDYAAQSLKPTASTMLRLCHQQNGLLDARCNAITGGLSSAMAMATEHIHAIVGDELLAGRKNIIVDLHASFGQGDKRNADTVVILPERLSTKLTAWYSIQLGAAQEKYFSAISSVVAGAGGETAVDLIESKMAEAKKAFENDILAAGDSVVKIGRDLQTMSVEGTDAGSAQSPKELMEGQFKKATLALEANGVKPGGTLEFKRDSDGNIKPGEYEKVGEHSATEDAHRRLSVRVFEKVEALLSTGGPEKVDQGMVAIRGDIAAVGDFLKTAATVKNNFTEQTVILKDVVPAQFTADIKAWADKAAEDSRNKYFIAIDAAVSEGMKFPVAKDSTFNFENEILKAKQDLDARTANTVQVIDKVAEGFKLLNIPAAKGGHQSLESTWEAIESRMTAELKALDKKVPSEIQMDVTAWAKDIKEAARIQYLDQLGTLLSAALGSGSVDIAQTFKNLNDGITAKTTEINAIVKGVNEGFGKLPVAAAADGSVSLTGSWEAIAKKMKVDDAGKDAAKAEFERRYAEMLRPLKNVLLDGSKGLIDPAKVTSSIAQMGVYELPLLNSMTKVLTTVDSGIDNIVSAFRAIDAEHEKAWKTVGTEDALKKLGVKDGSAGVLKARWSAEVAAQIANIERLTEDKVMSIGDLKSVVGAMSDYDRRMQAALGRIAEANFRGLSEAVQVSLIENRLT